MGFSGGISLDAAKKIKISYKEYIYHIEPPGGPLYIGQTARKEDSQRVWEHFGPKGKYHSLSKNNEMLSKTKVEIFPGPNFGISTISYNYFLSCFDPDKKNLNADRRATQVFKKSDYDVVKEEVNIKDIRDIKEFSIGNIVDIAEILHIVSMAHQLGVNNLKDQNTLANKLAGGQYTTWLYAGTRTRAFKKTDPVGDIYKIFAAIKPLSLNKIQKMADAYIAKYWFREGKGISDANWKAAENKWNNNNLSTLVKTAYLEQLLNSKWLEGLRNHLQERVEKTKYVLYNFTIEITLRDKTDSANDISNLFEHALRDNLGKKKLYTKEGIEKAIKEALLYEKTKSKATIPITMLYDIHIIPNSSTSAGSNNSAAPGPGSTNSSSGGERGLGGYLSIITTGSWWKKAVQKGIPVSENDKKLLAYEQFREIYFKVADGSFYQAASTRDKMIQLKTVNGAFAIYNHTDSSSFLSVRIKQAYQTLGITRYNDKWDSFFKQMISLMPTKLTDVGYNSTRGSKLYSRDEVVIINDKHCQVATFIPDGYLTPGQVFSLDKIKIY